jgi:hypothetical protein
VPSRRQPIQIVPHAGRDRPELGAVAASAQALEVGLRIGLIGGRQVGRHRHVIDAPLAMPGQDRGRDRVEGLGATTAAVVDAGCRRRQLAAPQGHRDGIVDVDEIAPVLARRATVRGVEQPHPALGLELPVQVPGDASHASLVLLARAVHVEVAQAHHQRRRCRGDLAHVLIERQLGIAVDVERTLVARVLGEGAAVTVDRGTRCVDQRHAALSAVAQQQAREGEVVAHHASAVPQRGVRAGAEMEYALEPDPEVAAAREQVVELVPIQVVADARIGEVGALVPVLQIVDDQHVAAPASVQGVDQVAADEAGASGDRDHDASPRPGASRARKAEVECPAW